MYHPTLKSFTLLELDPCLAEWVSVMCNFATQVLHLEKDYNSPFEVIRDSE
jgi:hypothetical protein